MASIPGLRRFTMELAARALILWEEGLNVEPESAPRISAGSGAASASDPDGSLYVNTGGVPESRIGSAWKSHAVADQTWDSGALGILGDVIAESTSAAGVTIDGTLLKDGGATIADGGILTIAGKGGTAGDIVQIFGSTTEGYQRVVYEATLSPAAVSTAVLTIPAGSIVVGTWLQVETVLTGGGTTATVSLGIAADVDQYGTLTSDDYTTQSDLLAADSKWSAIAPVTPLTGAGDQLGIFDPAAVTCVLHGAAAGGASAGDTALSAGTVLVRIEYLTVLPLDNV